MKDQALYLTHDYFGVDLNLVWAVVERDLPLLNATANDLIVKLKAPPDSP